MGTAERREREKEDLHERIVEAARDIVSEQGLEALSMRALAERIEYSPATIYLHFNDKEELLQRVMEEGFARLRAATREDLERAGAQATGLERWAAAGRAYARFALENTAYFRVMFELPAAAHVECPEPSEEELEGDETWEMVKKLVQDAVTEGSVQGADPEVLALAGWGLIHGLTSLFLGGQLAEVVTSRDQFMDLIDRSMTAMFGGASSETAAGPAA